MSEPVINRQITTRMQAAKHLPDSSDLAIARVISHRYGDGGVYLPHDKRHHEGRATLRRAIQSGFVSSDGFVTRKGRQLLARFEF